MFILLLFLSDRLLLFCCRVSLAKEMVDGLRIIFDFTVDNLLLYAEERRQFSEIRHITVEAPIRCLNRLAF